MDLSRCLALRTPPFPVHTGDLSTLQHDPNQTPPRPHRAVGSARVFPLKAFPLLHTVHQAEMRAGAQGGCRLGVTHGTLACVPTGK